ncbi:MAG: hypothetical protein AAF226_18750, partial [Verrucomicrobiota bacterium]
QADLEIADSSIKDLDTAIVEIEETVARYEQSAREARENRENLSEEIRRHEAERNRLNQEVASLKAQLDTNSGQLDSDQQRIVQLTDDVSRLELDRNQRSNDATALKSRISEQQEAIQKSEEDLAEMEQRYHQAKRAAADRQEDLSELHKLNAEKVSRLEVLEQLVAEGEGFEKGTQAVLRGLNDPDKYRNEVRKPLAAYLDVDPKYSDALEAALGRQLQTVVVSRREIAENVVAALREGKLGRASLIAADYLKSHPLKERGELPLGAIAWARDTVKANATVAPLVDRLLNEVLVTENLHVALKLQKELPNTPIATLTGEFVTAEGIIDGGITGDESISVLKRQSEIKDLNRATESLHIEVARMQDRRDTLNTRVSLLEDGLQIARDRLQAKKVG